VAEKTSNKLKESIIQLLAEDFISKIQLTENDSIGIFKALELLYEQAEIAELGIFLTIAKHEPIKTETIIELTKEKISKSTIYRKLDKYKQIGLLQQDQNNYWILGSALKSLKLIAEINKLIKKE
jgi:predicted transcriptional regulator